MEKGQPLVLLINQMCLRALLDKKKTTFSDLLF